MYSRIGTQDESEMSLTEMAWGLLSLIERLSGFPSDTVALAKPAIMRAFQAARELSGMRNGTMIGISPLEHDRVTLAEFHVIVVYLKWYCELLDHFGIVDTQNENVHVTRADFERAMAKVNKWSAPIVNWGPEFERLEAQGGGVVSFDKFSGWALRRAFESKLNLEARETEADPQEAPPLASGGRCGAITSDSGTPVASEPSRSPHTAAPSEVGAVPSLSLTTTAATPQRKAPSHGALSLTTLQLVDMACVAYSNRPSNRPAHVQNSAAGRLWVSSTRVGRPMSEVEGVASHALSAAGVAELRRERSLRRAADRQPLRQQEQSSAGDEWPPRRGESSRAERAQLAHQSAKHHAGAESRNRAPFTRSSHRTSVRI